MSKPQPPPDADAGGLRFTPRADDLTMHLTGLGYEYFRCRQGEAHDETVYVHQLLALATGPHDIDVCECDGECSGRGLCPWAVFSDGDYQVHHGVDPNVPDTDGGEWYNWPGNLALIRDRDHAQVTMNDYPNQYLEADD